MILRPLMKVPYFDYWYFSKLIILSSSIHVYKSEVLVKFTPFVKRTPEFILLIDCFKMTRLIQISIIYNSFLSIVCSTMYDLIKDYDVERTRTFTYLSKCL